MKPHSLLTASRIGARRARRGFLLLEAIMALGLFSSVCVALAVAIHQSAGLSRTGHQMLLLEESLESSWTEISRRPDLLKLKQFRWESAGVTVLGTLEESKEQSAEGLPLKGVWVAHLEATSKATRERAAIDHYLFAPEIQ